jgi:hypothetical protein
MSISFCSPPKASKRQEFEEFKERSQEPESRSQEVLGRNRPAAKPRFEDNLEGVAQETSSSDVGCLLTSETSAGNAMIRRNGFPLLQRVMRGHPTKEVSRIQQKVKSFCLAEAHRRSDSANQDDLI